MSMVNKEQLLYFFLNGKVSLSQYDYKFMSNLTMMISKNGRITTNQAELFDKLVDKYNRQLTKQGFTKVELSNLTWKTMLVESTIEYTGATVAIQDDELIVRVPFNKHFITSFRNLKDNPFEWNKDEKQYRAPFTTTAFKIAATRLSAHFPAVNFCEEGNAILTDLAKYESATVWNPTLKRINGRYVVAACNEILAEHIKDIELSLDPKTLLILSNMGIGVDEELKAESSLVKFASERIVEVEITEIETAVKWMKQMGCTHLVIGRGLRSYFNQDALISMVESYGISPLATSSFYSTPEMPASGTVMVIQHTSSTSSYRTPSGKAPISKTVVIKDSRPIEVK